jgi:Arm DNA-binding domain
MKRNRGKKLTKRVVDAEQPVPGERGVISDDELPELGPSIEPSGIKVFILPYRPGSGGRRAQRRFVKIGRYGVITPDQARVEAKRPLGEVARGNDPVAERAANRNEMTVADLLWLYEAEGLVVQRGKRRGSR